jgi:hypothetical protein
VSLSATDECVGLIEAAAAPIAPHRQPRFYERIAELVPNAETLSPAAVRDACARVQREFLNAPDPAPVEPPRPPSSPRSPYERRAR